MAKIFISISLAFVVITAALGFMAKGNIDKLKSSWTETKASLSREQANLQTARNELKKSAEDLAQSDEKAKATASTLEQKVADLSSKTQQLADAQKQVETLTSDIEKLKILVAEKPPTTTPDVANPNAIADLTEKLQKAQAELAEKGILLEAAVNGAKANETKLAELQSLEKKRLAAGALSGLQGRVLAVNAGWNFVVLNLGDKQGVAVNAPLLVIRGNTPIARLRITSVEPSTSVADLIPGSAARGVTVQPGDAVIFEGRTSAADLKPTVDAESARVSPRAS